MWIKEVEEVVELIRIKDEVDWDEELCAITYMVGRRADSPTLLFKKIGDNDDNDSLITNMPGPSINRIALGLGLPAGMSKAGSCQCTVGAYYTKWVAVDEDIDPTDIDQIIWAMSTRCNPVDNIDIIRNTWSTYLDPTKNPPEEKKGHMSEKRLLMPVESMNI